jgi:hypothetical protein
MSLTSIKCPACEAENEPADRYCVRCGIQINPPLEGSAGAKIICPRCQRDNPAESFFCYTCGKYFAEIQAAEAAIPVIPAVKTDAVLVPRARLVMQGGLEIVLTGSPTFIERGDFEGKLSPDLVMCISRQHILITYDGGAYFVQDYGRNGAGSTNHTRLNGDDIYRQGRQPLRNGDRIELAYQPELTLTFKQAEEKS